MLKQKSFFDRVSDELTLKIGSNGSLLLHTIVFAAFFALFFLGVDLDRILLVLTTIVSLEAIYLSVIIQRSVNKQSARVDKMIQDINTNTVIHLKEPLDVVVGRIEKMTEQIEQNTVPNLTEAMDKVVGEIKDEVDDLESRVKRLEKSSRK